ncbi:MAG: hypothetical protein Q9169_004118 [Polycauliona sp. 2 TL-2023]
MPPPTSQPHSPPTLSPLSTLPTELLTLIFIHLPTFTSILNLAPTSHALQTTWLHNVTPIYTHAIKPSITCPHHARHLLSTQGGPAPTSPITSAKDVMRIMRNKHAVEKAIVGFEREIVRHVKTRGIRAADYYGADALVHPPYLTRTERARVIRSYYTLWGLLSVDGAMERRAKLKYTSLKNLLYLCEMSKLPDGLGPGERVPSSLGGKFASTSETDKQRIEERGALSGIILETTNQTYRDIHGYEMELIWVMAMDEGFGDFLVIWDHWRSSLQEVVCGRRSKEPPYKKHFHWELWEDSDDGEGA